MTSEINSEMYRKLRTGVLLAFVVIVSSACAHIGDNVKGPSIPPNVVPFSVGFGPDGPIVFDQKGEKIQLTEVEFPVKAKEIQSMNTISAIQVKGSCFYILKFGGLTYKVPLPDSSCVE